MRKAVFIILALLAAFGAIAQAPIRTIVPGTPVVEGESFRVQYVITDASVTEKFTGPDFRQFRLVAGPDIYYGEIAGTSQFRQSRNYVYTLEAKKPGRYILPAARAIINGKLELSEKEVIIVISKEEAYRRLNKEAEKSEYFLKPGEDVQEKIRQNLFLKLMVDKKTCYVGEPVLATFKLYSRLESKSDIVKNPGFYGFTVFDMINLSDRFVTTETVNGKVFDVHTIRKVQLYPLQAGSFTIDPMELQNRIEFSRSSVYKKTEQEIMEGILGQEEEPASDINTTFVENDMRTEAVRIEVKPLPAAAKPVSYNGAVGAFAITANLTASQLAKNEEGILEIVVGGTGNFIQLSAPVVNWPRHIEGFEPEVKDMLDRNTSPTMGKRIFRYPFASATPGEYTIPAVEITYFNPDSGRYKTITTEPQVIHISAREKANPTTVVATTKKTGDSKWWMGIMALVVATLGAGWYYQRRKTATAKALTVMDIPEIKMPEVIVEELLAPAVGLVNGEDTHFYSALYKSVWEFFRLQFNLAGSGMNKINLAKQLEAKKIKPELIKATQRIIEQCEAGRFTLATMDTDKAIFLRETELVLKKIKASLL